MVAGKCEKLGETVRSYGQGACSAVAIGKSEKIGQTIRRIT